MAFLDIELGKTNGLDICRTLLALNPRTNVVYLTAYIEYAFDAWSTGASDFTLKPITTEGVQAQLKNLRYPLSIALFVDLLVYDDPSMSLVEKIAVYFEYLLLSIPMPMFTAYLLRTCGENWRKSFLFRAVIIIRAVRPRLWGYKAQFLRRCSTIRNKAVRRKSENVAKEVMTWNTRKATNFACIRTKSN